MKVYANPDQLAVYANDEAATWQFENWGGDILQMTRNFATNRATYEVFGYDEDAQDWVTTEVISKAEAERCWTIPEVLYS